MHVLGAMIGDEIDTERASGQPERDLPHVESATGGLPTALRTHCRHLGVSNPGEAPNRSY